MSDPSFELPPDIDGRRGRRRRAASPGPPSPAAPAEQPRRDLLPSRSTIGRLRAWLTIARVIGIVASIAGPGIVGYTLVKVVVDDESASTLVRDAVTDGLREEAQQRGARLRVRAEEIREGWRACEPACAPGDRLVGAWDRLVEPIGR